MQSLVADLKVDGVMTLCQATRHYAVPDDLVLRALPSRTAQVRPLRSSPRSVEATFVMLDPKALRYASTWALAHAAGTAELRHRLGADRSEWEVEATFGTHRADATWHSTQGLVAVEYDAGYPPSTVKHKLEAFREVYDAVVWGTTSSARVAHVESRHQDATRTFVQVAW